MSLAMPAQLRSQLWTIRHRLTSRLDRLGRAWRYFRGIMTPDDAQLMMREGYDVAGTYPLETLDVSDLLGRVQDTWGNHPALPELCAQAAERVYAKWESSGELSSAAIDYAMSRYLPDFAERAGVTLVYQHADE
jgi:hypothetical protein